MGMRAVGQQCGGQAEISAVKPSIPVPVSFVMSCTAQSENLVATVRHHQLSSSYHPHTHDHLISGVV